IGFEGALCRISTYRRVKLEVITNLCPVETLIGLVSSFAERSRSSKLSINVASIPCIFPLMLTWPKASLGEQLISKMARESLILFFRLRKVKLIFTHAARGHRRHRLFFFGNVGN